MKLSPPSIASKLPENWLTPTSIICNAATAIRCNVAWTLVMACQAKHMQTLFVCHESKIAVSECNMSSVLQQADDDKGIADLVQIFAALHGLTWTYLKSPKCFILICQAKLVCLSVLAKAAHQNRHAAQLHWQTARELIVPQIELQRPSCTHTNLCFIPHKRHVTMQ